MKNLKRIIAVFVAAVLLVCSFSFMTATAADDKDYVARVTLGYRDGEKMFEGHAFLYFENLTSGNLTVGVYTLPANKTVSLGTFGTMVDGEGLYYNVEAYRYNYYGLKDYISISKLVTEDELALMTEKIKISGFWSKFFNCTYFALTTWNETSGFSMPWFIFPEICNWEIKSYKAHTGYFPMVKPSTDNIYKQVGDGDDAHLVPASWHMEADNA